MKISTLTCSVFWALIQAAPAIEYVTKTHVVYVDINGAVVGTSAAEAATAAAVASGAAAPVAAEVPTTSSTEKSDPTTTAAAETTVATTQAAPATTSTSQAPAPTTSSSNSGSGNFQGDGTYYDPGMGACGEVHSASDYIVAISDELYAASMKDANPNHATSCGKKIRAFYGSNSVEVTVVDRCMGCKRDDLDLSPTAFEQIADKGLGRIKISWEWI